MSYIDWIFHINEMHEIIKSNLTKGTVKYASPWFLMFKILLYNWGERNYKVLEVNLIKY